jgi:hypothetical protein
MKTYLCGRAKCCPSVDYDPKSDMVYIEDDDGDIVKIKRNEFNELRTKKFDFL